MVAVSADPKVTETFVSMGRRQCVIDPAGATPQQVAEAVVNTQAIPARWEVEEASRSADAVFTEVLQ